MHPSARLLIAIFFPIVAMILWQTAVYQWRFGLLAWSQTYIMVIVGMGAIWLAFGPWRPLLRIPIVAAYIVIEFALCSAAAIATACAVGPCL